MILVQVILYIVLAIAVFMAFRGIVLWYFGIADIIDLLTKIADNKKPKK